MLTRRTFLAACASHAAIAQPVPSAYPPVLEGAIAETYKTIGEIKLNLWIYQPDPQPVKAAPAIIFFFGGGWTNGTPRQFEQHCKHFASRGMVAITADYRVSSRHQSTIADSVRDAKSAVRWVRANAQRLGIDPARLVAAGGSAGGHLAAATALIPGLDEPGDPSPPNALVLFNPVLVLASAPGTGFDPQSRGAESWQKRAGTDPASVSPYHHVTKSAPPSIIFHGQADTTVPYSTVAAFAEKMERAGVRCELIGYEGQQHGFFNYGRGGNQYFHVTLKAADDFLVSLDYLRPQ